MPNPTLSRIDPLRLCVTFPLTRDTRSAHDLNAECILQRHDLFIRYLPQEFQLDPNLTVRENSRMKGTGVFGFHRRKLVRSDRRRGLR